MYYLMVMNVRTSFGSYERLVLTVNGCQMQDYWIYIIEPLLSNNICL